MSKTRRAGVPILAFIIGLISGVVVDQPERVDDVIAAVVLSPILIFVGGGAAGWPFLIGGVLFWPVWLVLVHRWMTKPRWFIAVALTLWSMQGCFLLMERFAMVMSV